MIQKAHLLTIIQFRQHAQRRRHRDFGPVHVKGRIKRLFQRHGIARDERQLDLFPVAARQILDHAPALQPRLAALFGQHEPIGGFPDGCGHHIAEADGAFALAQQPDRERAPLLGAVLGEAKKRAVDLRFGLGIGEAQGRQLFEDGLHEALVGQDRQAMADRLAAIIGELGALLLDPEHAARCRDIALDLDLGANERVQKRRLRGERVGAEGKIAKQLRKRRFAGKRDRAERALAVENGEAF